MVFLFRHFFLLNSLYRQFPARAPLANTTEFLEIRKYTNSVEPGLGRTASEQAGYQMVALCVTLAIAVVGGVVTGMQSCFKLAELAFSCSD